MSITEGADVDALEGLAVGFEQFAERVEGAYTPVRQALHRSNWVGADADTFATEWDGPSRARLSAVATSLRAAATSLRRNAAEQREASESAGSGGGRAAWSAGHAAGWFPATGTGSALTNGKRTLAEALDATKNRIGQGQIEVRRLPNGHYVVILPGVVDLTDGMKGATGPGIGRTFDELRHGHFAKGGIDAWKTLDALQNAPERALRTWLDPDNPYGSVRDMSHAIPTALDPGSRDPYAEQVKLAMQAAGVPNGAQVMIVGHSYGGYAAMHLAADPTFNRETPGDGYSVHVTDAVSFGAGTSQYLSHVPADTNALVVGNRQDIPYAVESLPNGVQNLPNVVTAEPPNHHVAEFDGTPWVGGGHDQTNYESWLFDGHFDKQTSSILEGIGTNYSGRGEGVYVDVPATGTPSLSP
jgi:hypothetical protein